MTKEIEKRVLIAVGQYSNLYDYNNADDVKTIIDEISKDDLFTQSVFGKKYINRLALAKEGIAPQNCVICSSPAENRVVCDSCLSKIGSYAGVARPIVNRTKSENVSISQPKHGGSSPIEDLIKDMDDSLLQLASQSSVGTIKKLMWVNVALSIVNSIVIFFLALFIWRFIVTR